MAATPLINTTLTRAARRKVWVLNRHPEKPYSEEFRGETVTIEAGGKKGKDSLMDLITAEKFLSRPTQPQTFDSAGRETSMGKPLYIEELTHEEVMKYDPRNAENLRKEANNCMICGAEIPTEQGLKLHVKRMHPDYEPVSDAS